MTSLSKHDKARYSRHLRLPMVGEEGQVKLSQARVLVIGAGGLGCPVLQYLAAAGVGHLTIVDGDQVSMSNLQRQILFSENNIGQSKAQAAAERLQGMNSSIEIKSVETFFNLENALELVKGVDIVVDGTDNFQTRYLINDACVMASKPFVYASIHQFSGQLSVFNWPQQDGSRGPTYRCLFPTPPAPEAMPSCNEAGVMGALPGVLGTMQATEVLKMILGLEGVKSGKLVLINLLGEISQEIGLAPSPESQQISELKIPDIYCTQPEASEDTSEVSPEIDPWEFTDMESPIVLDVRLDWEYDDELKSINIPLPELEEILNHLPTPRAPQQTPSLDLSAPHTLPNSAPPPEAQSPSPQAPHTPAALSPKIQSSTPKAPHTLAASSPKIQSSTPKAPHTPAASSPQIEPSLPPELQDLLAQIPSQTPLVVVCSYGQKSLQAQKMLEVHFPQYQIKSLQGGLEGLKRLSML